MSFIHAIACTRSKEYRDWVTDHSSLINLDRKQGTALVNALTGVTSSNGLVNNILAVNSQALLDPSALMSYPAALVGGLGPAGVPGGHAVWDRLIASRQCCQWFLRLVQAMPWWLGCCRLPTDNCLCTPAESVSR